MLLLADELQTFGGKLLHRFEQVAGVTSKADGHGHFILLEVDGELHPFSDRNPVSTGGQHEFGTDR
ncbi:MAG: hypothetical protein LBT44_02790, partial [Clostridiales bacterium]|nr:hypothetical protein [Clostridiales bacterium]